MNGFYFRSEKDWKKDRTQYSVYGNLRNEVSEQCGQSDRSVRHVDQWLSLGWLLAVDSLPYP